MIKACQKYKEIISKPKIKHAIAKAFKEFRFLSKFG